MSSENKQDQKTSNGAGSSLSAGNLRHLPDESKNGNVDRFIQAAAADEPYFARARMPSRSEHMSRLSSQLDATDKIMKG
ncbi:hypothetical protein P170DRAFT_478406 [Aspergillus steynii IBT 23096]|uniref:Uncharacterized protein n=1 Tax=Aspergillus steynii IBT 23096 TaxID=1392250 RepID=A0A2I2FXS8_9EURO|nr:uncharacterized protein P170DRAFT_478406 [Aspergillus steynii IBT 23096]PLB45441.1 hypothetical protein P170DRAFT_478406 [Aspergillus steynii IBT 23096]